MFLQFLLWCSADGYKLKISFAMSWWFVTLFWLSKCERWLARVVGGLIKYQCRNSIWSGAYRSLLVCDQQPDQVPFHKCTCNHGTSCMPKKGQGILSQSGSIYIHTLRLWLAQIIGTHVPFWSCINTWLWGQQDSHLQQPWLIYSCQGMEMFQPQPCSSLAALVELTCLLPPSPQNNVVSWFHKLLATYR